MFSFWICYVCAHVLVTVNTDQNVLLFFQLQPERAQLWGDITPRTRHATQTDHNRPVKNSAGYHEADMKLLVLQHFPELCRVHFQTFGPLLHTLPLFLPVSCLITVNKILITALLKAFDSPQTDRLLLRSLRRSCSRAAKLLKTLKCGNIALPLTIFYNFHWSGRSQHRLRGVAKCRDSTIHPREWSRVHLFNVFIRSFGFVLLILANMVTYYMRNLLVKNKMICQWN